MGDVRPARPVGTTGWVLGLLGVVAFSYSLPANKLAVTGFDAVTITALRAASAGLLAAGYLAVVRAPRPSWRGLGALLISSLGVVVGFPLFSSLALATIGSGESAIILGLLPALTAVFAGPVSGERLPRAFWAASLAGVAVLIGYLTLTSLAAGHGLRLGWGELWMLLATACSAFGYAIGGDQAKSLGGPASICWSLVVLLPVAVPAAVLAVALRPLHPTPQAVGGLAYIVVVSQFLGFFAWYAGLARGGIARVGQVQQIQPILTLVWSAAVLGEALSAWTFAVGAVVAALVWVAQRARFSPGRPRRPGGAVDAPRPAGAR